MEGDEKDKKRRKRRRGPGHRPVDAEPVRVPGVESEAGERSSGRRNRRDLSHGSTRRRPALRVYANGVGFFTGPCPRCHTFGTVYRRTKTKDFRCGYCRTVVAPEEFRTGKQAIYDAVRDTERALIGGSAEKPGRIRSRMGRCSREIGPIVTAVGTLPTDPRQGRPSIGPAVPAILPTGRVIGRMEKVAGNVEKVTRNGGPSDRERGAYADPQGKSQGQRGESSGRWRKSSGEWGESLGQWRESLGPWSRAPSPIGPTTFPVPRPRSRWSEQLSPWGKSPGEWGGSRSRRACHRFG
jgi:hypothetical protein